MTITRLIATIMLAGAPLTIIGGDISGKVTLKGIPPKEIKLPLDAQCSKARQTPGEATTRFYVTDENGGLAEVFITLNEVTGSFDMPSEPVVLDQVSCEYTPYVLTARVGQKIVVKNSDPVLHNVHPTPKVQGNPEYNKVQLPRGEDLEFTYKNAERFLRFKCDVHPWMFAYVNLVDHPFFSVSAEDGSYTIKNVPPGEYEIQAIHRKTHAPKYEGIKRKIVVGPDGARADFVVDISK